MKTLSNNMFNMFLLHFCDDRGKIKLKIDFRTKYLFKLLLNKSRRKKYSLSKSLFVT